MTDRGTTHWEGCDRYPGCWRVHHECAKALLKLMANGWLAWQSVRLDATKARMDKIAREVVRDDRAADV